MASLAWLGPEVWRKRLPSIREGGRATGGHILFRHQKRFLPGKPCWLILRHEGCDLIDERSICVTPYRLTHVSSKTSSSRGSNRRGLPTRRHRLLNARSGLMPLFPRTCHRRRLTYCWRCAVNWGKRCAVSCEMVRKGVLCGRLWMVA